MLGFAKISRQVGISPSAPSPEWELKFLSEDALLASLNPGSRAAFRRVDVAQSADSSALGTEGVLKNEEVADLSQTAANSFIVQGSMSTALGLAQQNDWGPPGGSGGPPGDGPPPTDAARRGPVGPGGAGGGPPPGGGPGGPGGGPGGPGGGGPGGPGGPGGFSPGGPGGGRGGPDWQGRPNAMVFGNGRRDPSNMYMASAMFSLDNSIWDARTFSVTGANLAKPAYANGRGGVTFGGPLRIPRLVSASKRIMFTFDLQFQRSRTGTTSDPVNMPTALERAGDFSQTSTTIYDPATGTPFPGNKIPASRLSVTSLALLQYFPEPNLPFATRNFQTAWTGLNNTHNLNSRVSNIRIGGKDRLNFGIGYQGSDTVSPNLFQFIDTGSGRGINANLAWSHTITKRVTNNVQYNFSRMRQLSSPYFAGRENVAADFGIAGTSQNSLNWGPPNLSFTNYAGLTDGNYSLNRNQTSAGGDSLTWVRGAHNFTFGTDYRRQQFNQLSDSNGRGTYSFNGSATSYLVDGVAQNGTGYDLADFLLGLPATSSIRYGNPDKYFRGSGYDVLSSSTTTGASPRASA
ncbi:conserved hypothetical protein [Candidatus Sulfopaludibacter sp. SbA6]|nr:conserved hypothetical protein [Candidatus Sulfopaludibacter sp. SbA6]